MLVFSYNEYICFSLPVYFMPYLNPIGLFCLTASNDFASRHSPVLGWDFAPLRHLVRHAVAHIHC